jgi:hypothetical protein
LKWICRPAQEVSGKSLASALLPNNQTFIAIIKPKNRLVQTVFLVVYQEILIFDKGRIIGWQL